MAAMSQRTCKWVEAHVDDYLSGGLSDNERERVELHITTCFDCTETIDTTDQINRFEFRPLISMSLRYPGDIGIESEFNLLSYSQFNTDFQRS